MFYANNSGQRDQKPNINLPPKKLVIEDTHCDPQENTKDLTKAICAINKQNVVEVKPVTVKLDKSDLDQQADQAKPIELKPEQNNMGDDPWPFQ